MRMKKTLLLTFLIMGLTLIFSASKAFAVILATSTSTGTIDWATLSISTTYNEFESMSHAWAQNEVTADFPADVSLLGWGDTSNSATVDGAVSSSFTDPDGVEEAHSDAYAEAGDGGVVGYSESSSTAWFSGHVDSGSGGTVTISVGYSLSLDLSTSLDYAAWG